MLMWLLAAALAHPLDGEWVLDTDAEAVVLSMNAAVDKALASWPNFAVVRARAAIVAENKPCGRIVVEADTFATSCDDRGRYERPPTGSHTFTEPESGKEITTRLDVKRDTVRIQWNGPDGKRADSYRLEGDQLIIEHRITSSYLPKAVRWEVRYRRK
jgi:hypothetical protein